MDWEKLFNSLPNFIKLFVPGYIFILVYRFFNNSNSDSFEATAVISVIASYVFNLIVQAISLLLPMPDIIANIVAVIIAAICAILFAIIQNQKRYKLVIKKIGKITGSKSIWNDILDKEKGSHIRCYTQFNHKDAIIEGDVLYSSVCQDGECRLALVQYTVLYSDGTKYDSKGNEHEPVLYLNSANLHGIEITYGVGK